MNSQNIRSAAVAGMFYPAQADELQSMVNSYLSRADLAKFQHKQSPKAIIAPHAGYIYSGPIAASAYRIVQEYAESITRVILIGPSHRVPLFGFATSSADFFASPLGNVPIDRKAVDEINKLPDVKVFDQAHLLEHSLEVHIPFLQTILNDFSLVPVVAGEATVEQVADLLEILWGGPETLVVVSSDLSHYHDYSTAKSMDSNTCKAIESFDMNKLDSNHACGYVPVRGLLMLAKKLGLHATTVDYRNSGDTAGSKDQVVGYGSYVFT